MTNNDIQERKPVDVFEIDDVEFYTEKEAIAYQEIMKKLINYQYVVVEAKLDNTQEGLFYSELLIIAKNSDTAISFVYNYLFEVYGTPLVEIVKDKLESNYKIYDQLSFKHVTDLQEFCQEQQRYADDNLMQIKFIAVDNKGKSSRYILDKERIVQRIKKSVELL